MNEHLRNTISSLSALKIVSKYLPFPFFIIDKRGKVIFINQMFTEIFGFDLSTMPTVKEFLRTNYPDKEIKRSVIEMASVGSKESISNEFSSNVFEVKCFDGSIKHILYRLAFLYDDDKFLLICEDVSQLISTQKNLRESQEKYKLLIECTPNGIGVTKDGNVVFANKALLDILGYEDFNEVLGKTVFDFISENSKIKLNKQFKDPVSGINEKNNFEIEMIRKDGQLRIIDFTSIPIDIDGEINSMGLFVDITDRRKDELALVEKNKLNHLLLDSLPHPAMLITKGRVIKAANKTAIQAGVNIGGYCWQDFGQCLYLSKEKKKQLAVSGTCNPEGAHCTFCLADQAMKFGKPKNDPEVHAFERIWDTYWVPLDDDIYLHYAIDITEKK